jgi:aminoglycoside phosphotransferase (APT) family kinase protein
MAPGASFKDAGTSFRVLRADRNVIAEAHMAELPFAVIAKWSCAQEPKLRGTIAWEARQWEVLRSAVAEDENGVLPALIAFDEKEEVLLLEKLRGRSAYSTLALSPLSVLFCGTARGAADRFHQLGRLLATLHNRAIPTGQSPIHFDLTAKLRPVEGKVSCDSLLAAGLETVRRLRRQEAQRTRWVHGNLRTDNIIFTAAGPALIDLENAGSGDPHEDVGRLIAFVMMFRRFRVFPRAYWKTIIAEFIAGYGVKAGFSAQQLWTCVLGEMLLVYGRDYVREEMSIMRRHFKRVLQKGLRHLHERLEDDRQVYTSDPTLMVA